MSFKILCFSALLRPALRWHLQEMALDHAGSIRANLSQLTALLEPVFGAPLEKEAVELNGRVSPDAPWPQPSNELLRTLEQIDQLMCGLFGSSGIEDQDPAAALQYLLTAVPSSQRLVQRVESSAVVAFGGTGTMPNWTMETWRLCCEHRWDEAMRRQAKLIRWETEFIDRIHKRGHNHAIVGKVRASLGRFIIDNGLTHPPYYPVNPVLVEEIRAAFHVFWVEEDERENG
jgi:hypothetical protein